MSFKYDTEKYIFVLNKAKIVDHWSVSMINGRLDGIA